MASAAPAAAAAAAAAEGGAGEAKDAQGETQAAEEVQDEVALVCAQMRAAVAVQDRRYRLTVYPSCFVGEEAVRWLLREELAQTEEDALRLGNIMMAQGLFQHVTGDHAFKNGFLFYRFRQDERSHGRRSVGGNAGSAESWGDMAAGLLGRLTSSAAGTDPSGESGSGKQPSIGDTGHASFEPVLTDAMNMTPLDEHNVKLLDLVHPPAWEDPEPQAMYNLVVLGAGAGGLVSSAGSVGLGARVAIVEEHLLGGDCLNVGCVPSKALLKCASIAHTVRTADEYGVEFEDTDGGELAPAVRVNFPKVMERMRRLRAAIAPNDSAERLAGLGVDVFLGRGAFVGPNTIEVNGKRLNFRKAVIATGGSPAVPPIRGLHGKRFLTNATVFNLTQLPPRLVILGSGPIGMEMATAFNRFGSHVIMLERGHKILPKEDEDAAAIVQESAEAEGIEFRFRTVTEHVAEENGVFTLTVRTEGQEGEQTIQCEELLLATGRRPNVNNIGLEQAGVQFDVRRGVEVNDRLQTSNKNIYAVGDCCSMFQFTHVADSMARIVIRNALFPAVNSNFSALTISWCTFTSPEVAHVGLYPADLERQNREYRTFTREFSDVDRCIVDGTTKGFVKIHTAAKTDEILGATIVGEGASDMISEVATAMAGGLGLGSVAYVIHPYPTRAEAIRQTGDAFNRTKLTSLVKSIFRNLMKAQL